jgi:hypothetical protein
MALATPLGNQQARFRTRRMVSQLNLFRHQYECPLNPKIKQELVWWTTQLTKFNGQHILTHQPTTQFFTDASYQGWRIISNQHPLQGTWTPTECRLHVNIKELLVIRKLLEHFSIPLYQHLQLWRNSTFSTEQSRDGYLEILLLSLNQIIDSIRTLRMQSSRCTIPTTTATDRMDLAPLNLHLSNKTSIIFLSIIASKTCKNCLPIMAKCF